MKLIFYGTMGAVPLQENGNVSFAVIADESSVLVDASGSPVRYLMKSGIDPLELDALVLTHAHPDHIYAFPALIHNLWLMKREKPLYIVTNPATATKAKQLCDVFALSAKKGMFPITWKILDEGVVERIPGLTIELFPVEHSIPTSGVKFVSPSTSLVYSSDTASCTKIIHAAEGASALIHEASGSESHERDLHAAGHSSAKQAGQAAKKAGVDTLYLCHFDAKQKVPLDALRREAHKVFRGKVIIPELFMAYKL